MINRSARKAHRAGRRQRKRSLVRTLRVVSFALPSLGRPGIYPWVSAAAGLIPHERIQAYCDAIAREFKPDKIVLFGSYAGGTPTADSDVDLLVIMPYHGRPARQAFRIRSRFDTPFPLDLIVRTPEDIADSLRQPDMFVVDVMKRGKILYDAEHA